MSRRFWSPTFVGFFLRWRHKYLWRKIDVIPDGVTLWRAIPPSQVKRDGKIKASFFRDNRPGSGLSCDIAAFSSKEASRRGYATPPAWDEALAGLVEFEAGQVRQCSHCPPDADVVHNPLDTASIKNYGHAVFTKKLCADEEKTMVETTRLIVKPKDR